MTRAPAIRASVAHDSESRAPGPPVILLCAGYGTRLGERTRTVPKPLLPVAGRPLLDHFLDRILPLAGRGPVHVVSNHRYASAFETWAEELGTRRGETVTVHDDGTTSPEDRLGAVGDLRFVLDRIGVPASGALVAAGDNVFLFSLERFWNTFRAGEGETVVLALDEPDLERLRQTGVLELSADAAGDHRRCVVRLHEKPAEPPSSYACPSCYAFGAEALRAVAPYLDQGGARDEIGRFVGHWIEQATVWAVPVAGQRLHVGNPRELAHAGRVLGRD